MEHEDQCKESQDGSDKNDGRRIYQDVREVKTNEAFALMVDKVRVLMDSDDGFYLLWGSRRLKRYPKRLGVSEMDRMSTWRPGRL